jgi:hypothetical protein
MKKKMPMGHLITRSDTFGLLVHAWPAEHGLVNGNQVYIGPSPPRPFPGWRRFLMGQYRLWKCRTKIGFWRLRKRLFGKVLDKLRGRCR